MKLTKMIVAALSMVMMASLAAGALAEPPGKVVREHQKNQAERIKAGVNNGELTRQEAHRLRDNHRDIMQAKKMAKADGNVTKKEAHHLERMQERQSKAIYRQKHDKQERP